MRNEPGGAEWPPCTDPMGKPMTPWQFRLHTRLPPARVAETLQALTLPAGLWYAVRDGFPFRGQVWSTGFALREVTDWRHLYMPRLLGQVSRDAQGTRVGVRVRPSVGARGVHLAMTAMAYLRTDLLGIVLAASGLFIVVWVLTLALSLTGKRLLADALQAWAVS